LGDLRFLTADCVSVMDLCVLTPCCLVNWYRHAAVVFVVEETRSGTAKSLQQFCLRTSGSTSLNLSAFCLHTCLAIRYIHTSHLFSSQTKQKLSSFKMFFEDENFFGCTKKSLCLFFVLFYFFIKKLILHLQTGVVRQRTLRAGSGISAASTALN
jgi:hypothetical protein